MEVKNELTVPRDLMEDFFKLLDRQTDEKLPANMLMAFLGLFELAHILNMVHGSMPIQEAMQRSQQVSSLKDNLLNMLSSQGGADLPLAEMASMLGGKNPAALMSLLKMLAGPHPGAPPPAPDPLRPPVSAEGKKPVDDARKISNPNSK
ncbi:MAG: hypothetical protein ACOY9Y_15615 [Bacillota bacterium]